VKTLEIHLNVFDTPCIQH